MSQKKQKRKADNEDRLEIENRELKSLNRSLLRQLKKMNKGIKKFEWDELDCDEYKKKEKEVELEDRPDVCESCKRGVLVEIDLGIKTIKSCHICGFRSKPIDKK